MLAFLDGRWTEALSELRRAERAFRTQRGGSLPYNIVVCQLYGLHSLFYLGRFDEFARWIPECLAESLDRGDLYAEANLRLHQATLTCFVDDDPDTARGDLERAMARWSRHGYHMEHAVRLFRAGDFALYAGDAPGAWRVVDAEWPRLSRSLLRRVDMVSIVAWFLRGRAAVALAATLRPGQGERRRLLRVAARAARALVRRREGWGVPLGRLVEAGVARIGGDPTLAGERLAQAELRFDALDMDLHAATAQWRRGQLTGGEKGEALADAARDRMTGLGVTVPERIVRMLTPGL